MSEWISVKDRLPELGSRVLTSSYEQIDVDMYDDYGEFWGIGFWNDLCDGTWKVEYWMDLPDEPYYPEPKEDNND